MTSSKTHAPQKIALLKGGWNSERDVSLTSAKGVSKALHALGHEVHEIDVTKDIQALVSRLVSLNPDVVFMNALHGQWVEDGALQGVIELLGLPYTNSGVMASSLAMDKDFSRRIFGQHGLPIPKGQTLPIKDLLAFRGIDFPFVVKPVNEGSSVGVSIIHNVAELETAVNQWCYGPVALVEEYIPGKELSVAILGDRALGVLELEPTQGFYDYKNKYTDGKTIHHMPARISSQAYEEAMTLALKASLALGCKGVSRVDIRFDDIRFTPGKSFILEVNTQPGMTPLSIVPDIAAHAGLSFENLIDWMVRNPICPQEETRQKPYPQDPAEQPDASQKKLTYAA